MTSLVVRQLTIAHKRWDTRIWVKQIATLQKAGLLAGYEVADGEDDVTKNGVTIRDLGGLDGRGFWPRMRLILRATRRTGVRRGELLHFHDPLFLPGAIWLKLKGFRIVYDVHEDYPRQVLNWQLPGPIRFGASVTYSVLEWLAGRLLDGIVAATPKIAERFPPHKTVVVQNFPILSELVVPDPVPYAERRPDFAYVGGISGIRGAKEMVEAVGRIPKQCGTRLQLAGSLSPASLENQLRALPGWERINFLGWVNRAQVAEVLGNVRAGLVVLHPTQNYLEAYPVKMFEYMAAALPVIASDFPLWREIVEGAGCGLLVNPVDSNAIADAMQWLLDHPEDAEEMGKRGQEAVKTYYNWEQEADKLMNLYHQLIAIERCR